MSWKFAISLGEKMFFFLLVYKIKGMSLKRKVFLVEKSQIYMYTHVNIRFVSERKSFFD